MADISKMTDAQFRRFVRFRWLWLLKRQVAFRLLPYFGKRVVHTCDSHEGKIHYWRGRMLWGFHTAGETRFFNLKPGIWIPIPRGYSYENLIK